MEWGSKYKGSTYAVVARDRGFSDWVLRLQDPSPAQARFQTWLRSQAAGGSSAIPAAASSHQRQAGAAGPSSPSSGGGRTQAAASASTPAAKRAAPPSLPSEQHQPVGSSTPAAAEGPTKRARLERAPGAEAGGGPAAAGGPVGGPSPYVQRSIYCWKCKKETPVFSWQGHIWMQVSTGIIQVPSSHFYR